MTRVSSLATSTLAAILLIAATATHAAGQGTTFDKRTIFTFSRAVQVPGATLPAGKYVFRVANPASPNILTVLDATERHVLGQFFFISSRDRTIGQQNRADGKPVLEFYETEAGTPPAIRVFYYPTDVAGREFIYPKEQAARIAAVAHRQILATDTDVTKGGKPKVLAVEAAETTGDSSVTTTAEFAFPAGVPRIPSQDDSVEPQPVGTSGTDAAQPTDSAQPAGTTGPPESSSLPAALPETASLSPLIAFVGTLALAGGIALRRAGD